MSTSLVSARVDQNALAQSKRLIFAAGLTVSDVIRSMFDAIVRTGSPTPWESSNCTDSHKADARLRAAQATTAFVESVEPQPLGTGWGDVSHDRQLLNEWRDERFVG